MADLGQAYVQIIPKAEGISGKISEIITPGASSAGEHAGTSMASKIKKAIVAAGIGTAVVGTVKAALAEGGNLQQSYLGGLDTLYGDAADAARAYAREAATAGISMNNYAEQAVSFGAALKSAYGGDTMAAAEAANTAILDMADNAAKMGTPLESIQNAYQGFAKQNYTMLDNLKLGYGGTKSEMERLFADAQKISGVEYNLDNLGDVYDAIHVIQEDLGLTGVAAAEASETFTGSFGAMKASWSNLLGSMALGENVEPAFQELVTTASTFLFDNLIPMVGTVFGSIKELLPSLIAKLWDVIPDALTSLWEGIPGFISNLWQEVFGEPLDIDISGLFGNIGESFNKVIESVKNVIGEFSPLNTEFSLTETLANALSTVLTTAANIFDFLAQHMDVILPIITGVIAAFVALKAAMAIASIVSAVGSAFSLILSPIGLVVAAIAAVVAVGILLYQNWDQVKEWLVNTWNTIKDACKEAWDGMKTAIMTPIIQTKNDVVNAWNVIKTTVTNLWNGIKATASTVFNAVKTAIMTPINAIKSAFTTVWNAIKSTTSSVWNGIKNAITNPIQTAKNTVSNIISAIRGFFNFSISWPHIPMPHFSISPAGWKIGDLLKGSIPSLGISWYAKGGILDDATLIGAGEAGREAVLPLENRRYMRPFAQAIADEMGGGRDVVINVTVNGAEKPEDWAMRMANRLRMELRTANG